MYSFAPIPTRVDYERLADYLAAVSPDTLHPALHPQRQQVAERLRRMAVEADSTGDTQDCRAHASAYHALRLFVW